MLLVALRASARLAVARSTNPLSVSHSGGAACSLGLAPLVRLSSASFLTACPPPCVTSSPRGAQGRRQVWTRLQPRKPFHPRRSSSLTAYGATHDPAASSRRNKELARVAQGVPLSRAASPPPPNSLRCQSPTRRDRCRRVRGPEPRTRR